MGGASGAACRWRAHRYHAGMSSTPSAPPALPSRFWSELGTRDFARLAASPECARTVAVLPVAATEQHGPHLPVSVDATLLQGVVDAALALLPPDLPVLFLPPQNVGLSPEHARFPGTLTLAPATLIALWTEIGESVARAGIRKLLLFNSHGGQVSVMDIVARELRARCGLLVYSASWFGLPQPEAVSARFSADEHRFGIHAGDIETSMMLHLAPGTVHMEQARHFHSTSQDRAARYPLLGNGKSAKLGWQMQDYHPAGAVGNAAAATPEKGRALVEAAAAGLAQLLQEIADLPLSTLCEAPELHAPAPAEAGPATTSVFPRAEQGYAGDVTPQQAWEWVRAGEAVLVDVRSDAERAWVGQVPGAAAVAWKQWPGMEPNPDFDAQLRAAVPPGQRAVLLCRSGVRSIAAAQRATQLGMEAWNVLEGFEGDPDERAQRNHTGGWRARGLPWRQT